MSRWMLIILITLTALTLTVMPSFAGIRSNRVRPHKMEIDGVSYGYGWEISAPTLQGPDGYLAYDPSGKSPEVTFQRDKGPGITWSLVEYRPYEITLERGHGPHASDREQRGCTLKIQVGEGPFEGWYLGRVNGSLVLVKDRRQAATLRLIEEEADVIHK